MGHRSSHFFAELLSGLNKRMTVPIVASFGGSLIKRGNCRITGHNAITEKCQTRVGSIANRDLLDQNTTLAAYLLM